ncbi:TOM1-like protein 2-like isoform 2 [Planoprotostelium fungivorum]|uniref:TOM1-like protein 2-like isoform 2 n=1 Tax=Planoprotostelium fungivorum TaxID=1890364 RepID=A0A2P6NFL3_9EUKA|nr:TOM1-like protein 2-like isoform 2 [Planoprotostelium fungivorum]
MASTPVNTVLRSTDTSYLDSEAFSCLDACPNFRSHRPFHPSPRPKQLKSNSEHIGASPWLTGLLPLVVPLSHWRVTLEARWTFTFPPAAFVTVQRHETAVEMVDDMDAGIIFEMNTLNYKDDLGLKEPHMSSLVTKATLRDAHRFNDPEPEATTELMTIVQVNPNLSDTAVKLIGQHLKAHKKDVSILWTIVTLVDMMVKSCGTAFHQAVSHKDFVERMKKTGGLRIKTTPKKYEKIARKRSNSSLGYVKCRVQEKVLACIQCWGFCHADELPRYSVLYHHLKKKGVRFPRIIEEDEEPFTYIENSDYARKPSTPKAVSRTPSIIPEEMMAEMEEMRSTVTVLESLLEATIDSEELTDNEVARDLQIAARKQKERLHGLIERFVEKSPSEKLLNLFFILYERMEKAIADYEQLLTGEKVNEFVPFQPRGELVQETVSAPPSAPPQEHHEETNPFRAPASQRTAWELGMELLENVSGQNADVNDPFLEWLLHGKQVSANVNVAGNPFLSASGRMASV